MATSSVMKEGRIIRETIGVYCRLRPPIPEDEYVWDGDDDVEENNGHSGEAHSQEQQLALVRKDGFCSITQTLPTGSDGRDVGNRKNKDSGSFTYRKSPQDGSSKEFRFHGFFGPVATQEQVYESVGREIVRGVLSGYNGTIFAYGQTGSGKTHTMRGGDVGGGDPAATEEARGLTPRALQDIFEGIRLSGEGDKVWSVTVSYLQIYCEMLQDLFDPSNANLSIRERDGRVYVEGLSRVPVQTLKQCMVLLEEGDANRTTACTKLNATSSRSHAALIVHVTRREDSNNLADGSTLIESTLYLVDLAGSERAKRSGATLQRFEELKSINLSLSALGNCISALSQGRPHIPYRDSKLTRLLQQSLGGNSRTSLIVNVPPGHDVMGESHCSLLFAQRAMNVAVVAKVNRQIDYAQLYTTAQAKLDKHDDTLTKLQLEKAKQDADLIDLQSCMEELRRERGEMEKKLLAAEAGFKEGLRALESTSLDPGGERAVAAVETVSQKWRAEVENLESLHARESKELKAKYERRMVAYKHSLDQANEGWQAVELELTREREGHLATLTDYRRCHDRLLHSESESSARIAELLAEVNERTNAMEDLQAELEAARDRAKQREEVLGKMQIKVRDLELHQSSGMSSSLANEAMVPKSQVQTMEKLFAETVGRLEDRVRQLEGGMGGAMPAPPAAAAAGGGGRPSISGSTTGSRTTSMSQSHHNKGGGSGSVSLGSNRSGGYTNQRPSVFQQQQPPALWATRRVAPAAASSGFRAARLIEPGRPRASSFHGTLKGGSSSSSSSSALGGTGRGQPRYSQGVGVGGSSSYRAYHL